MPDFIDGADPSAYGLEVFVVEVTPDVAEAWLTRNHGNRRPKPPAIARYARDMAANAWTLTAQSIIFDRDGNLRNGQNRLMACVEAGKAFETMVVFGVDPASFMDMDTGPARTYGDVITIASDGEMANAHALGALAAMVYRYERGYRLVGGGQSVNPSPIEVLDVISRHPLLHLSVGVGVRASKRADVRPPRVGAFAHYRFATVDREAADEFFHRLVEMDFDGAAEPLKLLAGQLRRMNTRDRSHDDAWRVLYYTFKTWRVWRLLDPPIAKLTVGATLPDVE